MPMTGLIFHVSAGQVQMARIDLLSLSEGSLIIKFTKIPEVR